METQLLFDMFTHRWRAHTLWYFWPVWCLSWCESSKENHSVRGCTKGKWKLNICLCFVLFFSPLPPFKLGAKESWRYTWTWIKERLLVGETKEGGWGGGWGEIFKSPKPPYGDTHRVSGSTAGSLHTQVCHRRGVQCARRTASCSITWESGG